MGDAVRRMQRHLQDLSRDHLASVEDRHHANLGWLQIELQQLCKQIEVEVRVELTRPPRLSFSKGSGALLPAAKDASDKPTSTTKTSMTKANGTTAAVAAALSAPKQRGSEDAATKNQAANHAVSTAATHDVIEIDADSDVEVIAVVRPPNKRMVTRIVKRTRKVLKPKKVVKTEKKLVKEQKPRLPQVDVEALKVVDLKSELKMRGLKQTGVKAVLVKRLQEALNAEDAAQADADEGEGTWVTKEVVEEVMEEVEEEYEEEIEEEIDEPVGDLKSSRQEKDPAGETASTSTPESIPATMIPSGVAEVAAERETNVSSAEDINAPSHSEKEERTHDKITATSSPEPNPKQSLSDMVAPMSDDEIVRESADGFISPEGKMLPTLPASIQKSSKKEAQTEPVASRLHTIVESAPTALQTPKPSSLPKAASVGEPSDRAVVNSVSRSQSEPSNQDASAKVFDEVSTSKSAPQSASRAEARGISPDNDYTAQGVAVPAPTQSATIKVSVQPGSTIPKIRGDTASLQNTQQNLAVLKDVTTPSRDLMERVKSLASSSRSSSISSLSAARRYTGSISYVEDSQPSPHQPMLSTDVSSHSARAASVSQVEIQARVSKAKTPDSGSSVPPPSERVAQSEPRMNAAKLEVEDEASRKRREEQENIQREAQRLRLAMKQSAKKRFEESKTTTLFWKRDNAKAEDQADLTTSTEIRQKELVSNSLSTAHSSTESGGLKSSPSVVSPHESAPSDPVVSGSVVELKKDLPVSKEIQNTAPPEAVQRSKPSALASQPHSSSATVNKKEPEKRVAPTRKRSSIVVDSSTSTLYPSKKRASLLRNKDAQPVAKRTSLTRTTSPTEPVVKRTSLTRATPPAVSAAKRTSLTRTTPPAESARKRTSTERISASAAVKRKRSSVSDELPVEATATSKRKSMASSQSGQSSTQNQAASTTGNSLKSSKTTTRTGIPTSVPARRRESASSTVSSSSSVSTSEPRPKPTTSVLSGGAVRRPANLVSGLHSFTTLLEKDSANLSSSQGSNTSSSRQPPSVGALKLAEKSRLLEQKKNLEKAKRKEALAKRYEEQRKADEEKRKKIALMKEKAEREARSKREQEQAMEKKQRDIELAKKRQQRLQEIRSGIDKKKPQGNDRDQPIVSKNVAPVSRVAGATSSSAQPVKASTKTAHAQSDSKEVTTYVMSENEESSESEEEKDTERNSKNIPKWAQRENLERALRIQFGPNAVDPTPSIFPDFVDTCDLEAIFEPTDVRKKKRFQRRTSSGNWLGDRPTAREKAVYKKDMGFSR